MIPRIRQLQFQDNFIFVAEFDDGKRVSYDMKDDIANVPGYSDLLDNPSMFALAELDESRTCVSWTEHIDLPSDTIYEYGEEIV